MQLERPIQTRFRFAHPEDLSLLQIISPRPIMQKVRRHTIKVLRPLVGN